jgi:hypothetical protein
VRIALSETVSKTVQEENGARGPRHTGPGTGPGAPGPGAEYPGREPGGRAPGSLLRLSFRRGRKFAEVNTGNKRSRQAGSATKLKQHGRELRDRNFLKTGPAALRSIRKPSATHNPLGAVKSCGHFCVDIDGFRQGYRSARLRDS